MVGPDSSCPHPQSKALLVVLVLYRQGVVFYTVHDSPYSSCLPPDFMFLLWQHPVRSKNPLYNSSLIVQQCLLEGFTLP